MCMYLCVGVHMCEGACAYVCTHVWRPDITVRCVSQSLSILFFEVGSFADHGMEFCDKRALGLSLSLFSRIGLQTDVTNPDFTQARDPDSGLHVCVTSILMTEPFPDTFNINSTKNVRHNESTL